MTKNNGLTGEALLQKRREYHGPVIERPYLIGFMVRLGIEEKYARQQTICRAYQIIYHKLRQQLDCKSEKARIGNYYILWANGIPIDALKKMTRKEASQMAIAINQKKLLG